MYIGKLIGISPQHIIVQSEIGNGFTLESLPAIGDEVLDKHNTTIGKIADIFGPVDRPLFSITPTTIEHLKSFQVSLGEMFYAIKPKQSQKAYQKRKDNKKMINKTQTGNSKRAGSHSTKNLNTQNKSQSNKYS